MEDWHPRAQRVIPRHSSFSIMDTDRPPRQVGHTTETNRPSISAEDFYGHQNYPHALIWYDQATDTGRIVQYVPLRRMSKTLRNAAGGVETNRWNCVQFEVAWTAGNARNMPKALLRAIRDWVQWVCSQTGCPFVVPIPFHPYPPENGIRLGSEPWRMGFAAWRNATGLFGHQHVPENYHGDPGDWDVAYILGAPTTPPPPEDDMTPAELDAIKAAVNAAADRIDARPIALRVDQKGHPENGHVYIVDTGARTRWYVDRTTLDTLYFIGTIQPDKGNQPAKIGADFIDEFRQVADPTPKG